MNIRFSYMYRDAGNFKNWGEIVFLNPHNISMEKLSAMLKLALLDEMYFDAFAIGVPEVFFDDYEEDIDHDWHEFERLEQIDSPPTDRQERTIETFLSDLAEISKKGFASHDFWK